MIYLLHIFLTLFLSYFSLSFLPAFGLWGVAPLLPLFFVISLAYFRRGFAPILLAALTGILLDFYSAYRFGFYLGVFLVGVLTVRFLYQEGMERLSLLSYITLVTIPIVISYVAQNVVLKMGGAQFNIVAMGKTGLAYIGVNLVFAIVIYPLVQWYFEYTAKFESTKGRVR